MLPNWHEAAVVYLGGDVGRDGGQPDPAVAARPRAAFILDDVDSRMIFVPGDFRQPRLRRDAGPRDRRDGLAARGRGGARRRTAATPPYASLFEPTSDADGAPGARPRRRADDPVHLGHHRTPKGVLHSHNSIHALIRQIRDHWLVDAGDKFLVPSPIAHIGGSIYAFECPLLLGTTAVLMDRWDADEAVALMTGRALHPHGGRHAVPRAAARRPPSGPDTRLPDLKVFICGGASVPPSLIRRAAAYFDRPWSPACTGRRRCRSPPSGSPDDTDHAADTDGRAGIADINDCRRRARSAPAARRCWSATCIPRTRRDAFDDDGYFRTGDLGRWVDDDYLVVTGRAKDIIIRNGENISPKEIEDILVGHPGIAEIAVVGVPDRADRRAGLRGHRAAGRQPAPTSTTCAVPRGPRASRSSKFLSRW